MSSLGSVATGAAAVVGFGSGLALGTISNFAGCTIGASIGCCGIFPVFSMAGSVAGGYFLMGYLDDSAYSTGVKVGIFFSTILTSQILPHAFQHAALQNGARIKEEDQLKDKDLLIGTAIGLAVTMLALPTLGAQGSLVLGGISAGMSAIMLNSSDNRVRA